MKLDVKKKQLLIDAHALSLVDIDKNLSSLKDQVFWLNFKNRSGQSIKVSDLQKSKKMIARLLTLKVEKLKLEKVR